MEKNIGLLIAAIGAGSAILGSLILQLFSWLMRRSEYREKHFEGFLDYRIKAHSNIVKTVYEIAENMLDMLYIQVGGVVANEIIYNNLIAANRKIGESVQNNSLWADTNFLVKIGGYREHLITFAKMVNERVHEINQEQRDEFIKKAKNIFTELMSFARVSSGVVFLNKEVQKLTSNKLVLRWPDFLKRKKKK